MALLSLAALPLSVFADDSGNETEAKVELLHRFSTGTGLHVHTLLTWDEQALHTKEFGLAMDRHINSQWSYRVGARYIGTSQDSSNNGEYRGVIDAQYKKTFADEWALINRSRIDLRWVEGKPFSHRLRDRIMLERKSSIAGHQFSPYASYEIYYDSRYDRLQCHRSRVGVTVPLGHTVTLDGYYGRTDQVYPASSTVETVGIALVILLD